jgi:hypothetical protein
MADGGRRTTRRRTAEDAMADGGRRDGGRRRTRWRTADDATADQRGCARKTCGTFAHSESEAEVVGGEDDGAR